VFFKIRNHTVYPSVFLGLLAAGGIALLAQRALDLSPTFALRMTVLFAIGGAAVALLAARHLPPAGFGPANQVTLVRAIMTVLVLALVAESPNLAVTWLAVAVATVALALDGIDGWLARRHGDSSAFGARFDMETDALLIFSIAALSWQQGKAGAWILAAGLLRYLFLASGQLLSWMQRPLPDRRRRRVICVVQIISLILCLLPLVPTPLSSVAALIGLTLLTASFAIDIQWLFRNRSVAARTSPGKQVAGPGAEAGCEPPPQGVNTGGATVLNQPKRTTTQCPQA
jgi:phosphatidylglycerophosphate synthase